VKGCHYLGLLLAAGLSALSVLPLLQADERGRPLEPAERKVDQGSLPEVQDVIFYTQKRPILMRMRLFVDDKPGNERWNEFQKKLFAYLDADGDGFLDKVEADRVIPAEMLVELYAGSPNLAGLPKAPPFEDLDLNKDGKISPEELRAYYRRSGAGPVNVVTAPGQANTADQLTNALFAALDPNNDGKLTKEKLQVADKILLRFDDNDDELITPQELLATAIDPYTPLRQLRGVPVKAEPTRLLLVPKDYPEEERGRLLTQRRAVLQEVIAKYDKDSNKKLSREESGFPKELFDELDKDKTGELTDLRLLRWLVALPDVECTVRLGQSDDKQKAIEAAGDGKGRYGLKLSQVSLGSLALSFAGSEVTVVRGDIFRPNRGPRPFTPYQQQFKLLFKQLDNGKGVIKSEQLNNQQQPQFMTLRAIFNLAVRADPDALTEKELEAFLQVADASMGCQIGVTFTDNGQGLFELLDSNGDGRLSIREMRNAWTRLSPYASDGVIARSELPRQYSLLVGRSTNRNGPQMVLPVGALQPGPRGPVTQRGPLWFRKMDVNGDGDVSEREFLGSLEDFRRINTSGDGLISVEEAEKADEWFRAKLQQK
jgi:Ca2+-binding EF-hand superfamily protein